MRTMILRSISTTAFLAATLLSGNISQAQQSTQSLIDAVRLKERQNIQSLIDAARLLKFSVPNNRAYILEKQETTVTEVAIIFRYGDNRSACEQMAEILGASKRAGTFKCHPVY